MTVDIKEKEKKQETKQTKKRTSYALKEKKVILNEEILESRKIRKEDDNKVSTTVYFTENFRRHLKLFYQMNGFSYLHEFVEDACKQIMEKYNYNYNESISPEELVKELKKLKIE